MNDGIVLSCQTLCDPMNCSIPGVPVLHHLPELAQTHVHWNKWSHPTISPSVTLFYSWPQSFPASESFPVSHLFSSGGQSIGVSASASVLPITIQGWFPFGLVWSPYCPRDSQVSSLAPQPESINSLEHSLFYGPALTSVHDYWKNHSLWLYGLVGMLTWLCSKSFKLGFSSTWTENFQKCKLYLEWWDRSAHFYITSL